MIFVLPTTILHLTAAVPADLLLGMPVFVGPFGSHVGEDEKFKFRYHQCRHLKSLMKDLWFPMFWEQVFMVAFWGAVFWGNGFAHGGAMMTIMIIQASIYFLIFTQGAHLREDTMQNAEANMALREILVGVRDRDGQPVGGQEEEVGSKRLQHFGHLAEYEWDPLHPLDVIGFHDEDPQAAVEQRLAARQKKMRTPAENAKMGRWIREQLAYTVDFSTDSYAW